LQQAILYLKQNSKNFIELIMQLFSKINEKQLFQLEQVQDNEFYDIQKIKNNIFRCIHKEVIQIFHHLMICNFNF